jgi:lysophospholipase L1-like esterase
MSIQKTVLCYGDSNTHGTRPDIDDARYKREVRWTGQLQSILGESYYIIEEGLGGRTTNLEHPLTEKPGRNGLTYLRPCLESHKPIDIFIVMLGTNDFKNVYNRSPKEVADVLSEYAKLAEEIIPSARLVFVSPAYITATEPVVFYDKESEQKSKNLAPHIEKVAAEYGASFIDAANVVQTGEDGIHWDVASQKNFAEEIVKVIKQF